MKENAVYVKGKKYITTYNLFPPFLRSTRTQNPANLYSTESKNIHFMSKAYNREGEEKHNGSRECKQGRGTRRSAAEMLRRGLPSPRLRNVSLQHRAWNAPHAEVWCQFKCIEHQKNAPNQGFKLVQHISTQPN